MKAMHCFRVFSFVIDEQVRVFSRQYCQSDDFFGDYGFGRSDYDSPTASMVHGIEDILI